MGFRDDTVALKAQLSAERRRAEQERQGLEMELEVLQRERRALQRKLEGRARKAGFWRRKNAAKFALAAVASVLTLS